jgi:hypothetical protein
MDDNNKIWYNSKLNFVIQWAKIIYYLILALSRFSPEPFVPSSAAQKHKN